jgi:hypothetical protein
VVFFGAIVDCIRVFMNIHSDVERARLWQWLTSEFVSRMSQYKAALASGKLTRGETGG